MGLFISRLLRSNLLSGCEAAGLDELQHLTLSDLEECAASAEQTAAALPSLSIWERRHRVSEIFTRAPQQPGSTATERVVKACLWSFIGVGCLVGLIWLVGLHTNWIEYSRRPPGWSTPWLVSRRPTGWSDAWSVSYQVLAMDLGLKRQCWYHYCLNTVVTGDYRRYLVSLV